MWTRLVLFSLCMALLAETARGAQLSLSVVDRIGRSHPAPMIVRNQDGEVVGSTKGEEEADIPPGTYIVEPAFDPGLATQVVQSQAGAGVIEIRDERSIWLRLERYDGKPPQLGPFGP
jgi:hypothetical protein